MSNFGRDPNIALLSQHWLTKAFVQFVFQNPADTEVGGRGVGVGLGVGGADRVPQTKQERGRKVERNFRSPRSLMKWGRRGQIL